MKRLKSLGLLAVCSGVLAACGGGGEEETGIETLGADFVRAFSLAPGDAPLDPSTLALTLSPLIEPFDP